MISSALFVLAWVGLFCTQQVAWSREPAGEMLWVWVNVLTRHFTICLTAAGFHRADGRRGDPTKMPNNRLIKLRTSPDLRDIFYLMNKMYPCNHHQRFHLDWNDLQSFKNLFSCRKLNLLVISKHIICTNELHLHIYIYIYWTIFLSYLYMKIELINSIFL